MTEYYVSGCIEIDGNVGRETDEDAEFFTLYEKDAAGLSKCVADFTDRLSAEAAMQVYQERDTLQQQVNALEEKYKVEIDGANERGKLLFDAKNHWADRARAAEAELALVKAQEPVAYRWEGKISGNICYDGIKPLGVISQPLYAEPRPAVLPQEVIDRVIPSIDPEGLDETLHHCEHAIYSDRERIRKQLSEYFGCQPQRFVVNLPEVCWCSGANYDREEVIEAIRAAGGEIAE